MESLNVYNTNISQFEAENNMSIIQYFIKLHLDRMNSKFSVPTKIKARNVVKRKDVMQTRKRIEKIKRSGLNSHRIGKGCRQRQTLPFDLKNNRTNSRC